MKHKMAVTIALALSYFFSQAVGLGILYQDINVERLVVNGTEVIEVTHPETAVGPRPESRNFDAVVTVLASIIIGTGIILAIIKLKKAALWKAFFALAVFLSITISLGVFMDPLPAAVLSAAVTLLKLKRPGAIVHNASELLVYSGIAVLFVPLFEPAWTILLLVIISVYDMFAVWKSRHMVKLAEFQLESKAFSGLSIPYKTRPMAKPKTQRSKSGAFQNILTGIKTRDTKNHKVYGQGPEQKASSSHAVLGGGDIAFPLLFSGAVLESLIRSGLSGPVAFLKVLIIPVAVTLCLLALLAYGKKGRYYPAMPFLTAGCLVGYWLVLIA